MELAQWNSFILFYFYCRSPGCGFLRRWFTIFYIWVAYDSSATRNQGVPLESLTAYRIVKHFVNPKISGWLGFGIFWSILVGIGVFMFRFHKLKYSSNHAILAKLMDAVSLENLGMLLIVFSIGVVLVW